MTFAAFAAFTAAAAAAVVLAFVPWPVPTRRNFRDALVPLRGSAVALVVLLGAAAALRSWPLLAATALAGAAGGYDDVRGDATAKGLAGHLGALRRGRVTSGVVKVVVAGAAGAVAGLLLHGLSARGTLAALLVAGSANLLNLFDLRPGRALKVALLLTLPVGTPLAYAVAGTAAGLLPADLRERSMLGDGGANALGAAAGVALAARLPAWGALAAVAVVVTLTLASERVSFSRVVDRVAPLRWADRLGRLA